MTISLKQLDIVWVNIYKFHSNRKEKIYFRFTEIKEKGPKHSTKGNKSQGRRLKEEENNREELQKQLENK